MWKQAFGFAVFGAVVAVLGAALGQGLSQVSAGFTFFGGGSSIVSYVHSGPWAWPTVSAAAGAVVGALTGVVLRLAGIEVSGRAGSHVVRTVVAGMVGVTVGLSPMLVALGMTAMGAATIVWPPLLVYGVSGVLAYVLGLVAVYWTLRAVGDQFLSRTTRAVAMMLPVGAVAATAVGVGAAWMLGYSTTVATWIVVVLVVVLVLVGTLTVARTWALRGHAARAV